MPAIKKQANESQHGRAIVDNNIKSHANDPFVLKKVKKQSKWLINMVYQEIRRNRAQI